MPAGQVIVFIFFVNLSREWWPASLEKVISALSCRVVLEESSMDSREYGCWLCYYIIVPSYYNPWMFLLRMVAMLDPLMKKNFVNVNVNVIISRRCSFLVLVFLGDGLVNQYWYLLPSNFGMTCWTPRQR